MMKTSTESQRRRSASSPSRPQSRQSPKSRPGPKPWTKNQSRTRTRSQTTINKSPQQDTINLDSSNEDGAAEPVSSPEPAPNPSPELTPDPSAAHDPGFGLGSSPGLDVVDLTSDLAAVVDLTNDTVLVLDEEQTQSYVVSSDEEEPSVTRTTPISIASTQRRGRSSGVHISCPVCMDSYFEIVDSGRLLVSTRCGHIFCSLCLRDALNQSHNCPICRKKLLKGHYHPLHL